MFVVIAESYWRVFACNKVQVSTTLVNTHKSLLPSNIIVAFACFGGGGGTTRPLPRDGGAEELRGDPTVGPHPKVWTIDRE